MRTHCARTLAVVGTFAVACVHAYPSESYAQVGESEAREVFPPPQVPEPTRRELGLGHRLGMFAAGFAVNQVGLWSAGTALHVGQRSGSVSLYVTGLTVMPLVSAVGTAEVVSLVGRRSMGYDQRDLGDRVGEAYKGAMLGMVIAVPTAAIVWAVAAPDDFEGADYTPRELALFALPHTLAASVIVSAMTTNFYRRAVEDYERGLRVGSASGPRDATARSTENLRWRWRWELSPAPGGGMVRVGATF